MGIQIQGTNAANVLADTYNGSLRATTVPRGDSYAISVVSGTIGAVLAINSCIFAMRVNPATIKDIYITQLRIQWCVTTAFTAPAATGRRLSIYRGYGAAASTGTAIAAAAKMNTGSPASQCDAASGGDMRIVANVTTAGLTTTGITFETQELETMLVAGFGAAGSTWTFERRYDSPMGAPLQVSAGQLLSIRNPIAMDAAGVFQIGVDLEWYEL
jgi:hypothetical protein